MDLLRPASPQLVLARDGGVVGPYVPLWCKSNFSFLEGASHPAELVETAHRLGIESLAAAVGEERGTIEDVIEPFLIQQGFMMRTARGRVATKNSYLHLGLTPPVRELPAELPLFDED